MIQQAQAGLEVSDAADELLSWEALTVGATLEATPEEVYAYLQRAAARDGGTVQPSADQARLLADLELTIAVGDPERETQMRELDPDDELDGAMTVNFGGRDVAGVKNIGDNTYVRVGAQAVVDDVYGGGEAAVARAQRLEQDAAQLPDSLTAARNALAGNWVEIDPDRYADYAAALSEGGGDGVSADAAGRMAGALIDGGELLTPEAQWEFVEALETTLRSEATLRPSGEARGAELVTVTMASDDARRALAPLLALLTAQTERFGLPPLVDRSTDTTEPVEAGLEIRNGVLTAATFDLGQFAGPDAGSLPLRLALTGGSALSLNPPDPADGQLAPEDLTVALLYLEMLDERREADDGRADVPGPMQP
ncbi:hypothetical protein E1265_22940 [Streptomyces sp. 8K308]|uniref:hypothetical protein n=1 Tax=Streptomyces sp. 8K308 TaxID=2530388 RepID=UPI00104A346F|nr:hypothetical protein [Streptomyces sp. 8K308]TDC19989.1 hypothetical protein E1265_22940 [Streptomyces sp. 8K308]